MKNYGIAILFLLAGCSDNNTTTIDSMPVNGAAQAEKPAQQLPMNVSILLDLSDRISKKRNPDQADRDKACIAAILHQFRETLKLSGRNLFQATDKINVYFEPAPQDQNITQIASELQVDFGKLDYRERKKEFMQFDSTFNSNVNKIYATALDKNNYKSGSNIWRFMKDDLQVKCIEKSGFRNVLIILTDGYMYAANDKKSAGNRYNYIETTSEHLKCFRGNNPDWEKKFTEQHYGFIPVQNDLSNLEILVLGIAPKEAHTGDFDILHKYWTTWFDSMHVKKKNVCKSELPVNTEKYIRQFFTDTAAQ